MADKEPKPRWGAREVVVVITAMGGLAGAVRGEVATAPAAAAANVKVVKAYKRTRAGLKAQGKQIERLTRDVRELRDERRDTERFILSLVARGMGGVEASAMVDNVRRRRAPAAEMGPEPRRKSAYVEADRLLGETVDLPTEPEWEQQALPADLDEDVQP